VSAVIVDTHAAIWYLRDPSRLSSSALAAMRQAVSDSEPIFISAISIVEVAYLVEKGRLPLEALTRLIAAIEDSTSAFLIAVLDIAIAQTLFKIPRDKVPDMPDRIIAATALHLNLPLITRDQQIQSSGIQTIW
jgi:PIN domain nuclease of toxin-antitoxin system